MSGFEAPQDQYVHPPSSMGISKWGSADVNICEKIADCLLEQHQVQEDLLKEALLSSSRERINSFQEDLLCIDGAVALKKMAENKTLGGWKAITEYSEVAPSISFIKEAEFWDGMKITSIRLQKLGADRYNAFVALEDEPLNLVKLSNINYGEAVKLVESVSGDPEQVMQSTERSGERIISAIRHNPDQHVNLIEDLVPERYISAPSDEFCKVSVYDSDAGAYLKGHLFGNVVAPSGQKTGYKLFITDGFFGFQKDMAVEILSGTLRESKVARIPYDIPAAGQIGTFVKVGTEEKDGVALIPFKIIKMIRLKGQDSLTVDSLNGARETFICSDTVREITPIDTLSEKQNNTLGGLVPSKGRAYLIPTSWDYVTLGTQRNLTEDPKMAKSAALSAHNISPVRLMSEDGSTIHMKGEGIEVHPWSKWGYNIKTASPVEALHVLIASGVDEDVALGLVNETTKVGKVIFNFNRKPYEKPIQEKEASVRKEYLKREISGIEYATKQFNLLKMAASIPDSATVNNVLGLRFIGPETFYHFSTKIPSLEESLSFLCTLLLTSRLDSSLELDEPEISSAIRLFDNIIAKLKKIRAVLLPK